MSPRVSLVRAHEEHRRLTALARPSPPVRRLGASLADDRYSRRVALLKRALPAIGLTLLLLVAGWPRLAPFLESVRLGFPAIDLREARELRMTTPRYAGLDRYNRPYVVTAAVGRQVPDRDDVMALERPRAEMTTHSGAAVVLTAATGIYQSHAQLLDLFGDVNLVHENGTRFVTQRAHLNLSDNTAEGHDPVEGHGPSGDVAGEGFQILSKGDTIIFTGRSSLLLKGTQPSAVRAEPQTLPPAVDGMLASIAAAAAAPPVAETVSLPLSGRLGGRPGVTNVHGVAKPRRAAKPAVITLPGDKPAAVKANQHAN
jgi:lipopolysaccharide export system protein LptC